MFVLFAGCILSMVSGSKILFDANPDVIQANLTSAMTMRCSLNDTVDVSGTTSTSNIVGKRDVSQTTENLQSVTSIVITRNNGDPVATVINGNARAQTDLALMTVKGDTSGALGERGYLELQWQYPGTAQTGEYVCEVNAVNSQGHNVVFSTSVEVGESMPTIGELMGHVLALDKEKTTLQQQIDELAKNLTILQNQTPPPPASTTPCTDCGNNGGGLHIEQGRIECDDSDNWQDDDQHRDWAGAKMDLHYHKFDVPYTSKPFIQVGVSSIDHETDANTRYDVFVRNVDNNGFTLECRTWADSKLYHVYVDWIAIAG